jgi:hypothetical protein
MKNWCKIIKLDEYDVSVMRLSTTEEGEHVELIARFPEGQFIKTASFEENKEEADKFFKTYNKRTAKELIEELTKLLTNDEEVIQ